MKKINSNLLWEVVGYTTLALCIFGQIAVGYIYLAAQAAYLIANILSVIRDYKLNLPPSNKTKDIVFSAITVGLIVIKIVQIV